MQRKLITFQAVESKPTTSSDLSPITTDCNDFKTLPSTRIQGDLKIVKINKCSDTYLVSISFFSLLHYNFFFFTGKSGYSSCLLSGN